MNRSLTLVAGLAAAAVAALAACGDRPQTLPSGVKIDSQAFQGSGMPYVAPGWKPGDQSSWEAHLKTRTEHGQNEYLRVK